MAIHERATDRLVGTCAFSQLDGENGSALYHITIGEKDAWGRGYGTEATRLMLDHAFGTLGLHRIALFVFEFNERAIRAYRRCGFVVEGRARESIWRDGRWWDELAMSVLETRLAPHPRDATSRTRRRAEDERVGDGADAEPVEVGRAPARIARAGSSATVGDDDRRARGRRRADRGPRADRRQGPRGRQRARRGGPPRGRVRRRAPRAHAVARPSSATSMQALEQDEGQKLGGKSAEAARFILRAIDRELDKA